MEKEASIPYTSGSMLLIIFYKFPVISSYGNEALTSLPYFIEAIVIQNELESFLNTILTYFNSLHNNLLLL